MAEKKSQVATARHPVTSRRTRWSDNPKKAARIVLGVLLGLNLVAALLLLEWFGGSPEGLEASLIRLESQLQQQKAELNQVKTLAGKMQSGASEGTQFIETYFMEQRQASSEILKTLDAMEARVGIRPRGKTFSTEAIEGTEEYVMLNITANYDGTYADLVEFVSAIDRSERLLILDSLQVAPQRDEGTLQIQTQLFAFVRQNNLVAQAREVTP